MSKRFTNLEFESPRAEQRATEQVRAGQDLPATLLARARQADEWGRFEEALRLYTRALGEDRALVVAWVGQVQMLVQLDECHEARVWSEKALQLFRNHGDLLAAEAQAVARLRDLKTARRLSDNAMQSAGDSPWRWVVRGEVLLAAGQRLAESCFEKAVQSPAADWFDHVVVARVLQHYRRFAAAVRYVKQAVTLQPEHGYPWLLLGQCQVQLGLASAARDSFGHAAELAPEWTEPRSALDALERSSVLGGLLRRLLGWRRRS
ncbi:MAG: tetratricopeptide repeat protein [Phycisphaerales bacterium]|nr:tetratricopeptide repeat protein [Phycisphaerales bacterium]